MNTRRRHECEQLEKRAMDAVPDYPIGTLGTVPRAPEAKGAPKRKKGKNMGTSDSIGLINFTLIL